MGMNELHNAWQIFGVYRESCDCINLIDPEQLQLYNFQIQLYIC